MAIAALSFSDLDLSDPDEQMKVTNNGKTNIEWKGTRRLYTIKPGESVFIPFHVIVKHLGDPRSEFKKTETFVTPTGARGVIPERRGEMIRLSIFYGLYHGRVNDLPKVAPKVTVMTTNDVKIEFPIYNTEAPNYRYQTPENRMVDPRQEFERLQEQINRLERQQMAAAEAINADDPEGGEAPEDSHPGL